MQDKTHDMFYGASPFIHKQAKEVRGRETKAEKILWNRLSNPPLNVKFQVRDEHLQVLGLTVIRFSNEEILKNTGTVINFLENMIKKIE